MNSEKRFDERSSAGWGTAEPAVTGIGPDFGIPAASKRRAYTVEAPVSGSRTPAEAGQLVAMLAEIDVHGVVLGTVAYLILLERKVASWVQDRVGPNRVGPWGLLQPLADVVKLAQRSENALGFPPRLTLDAIRRAAAYFQASGADVIDVGCTPGLPFPALGDVVRDRIRQYDELAAELYPDKIGYEAFLAVSEVVAHLAPGFGVASIERIAINAVMAGCQPTYFPVVLAAVKAVLQPQFNAGAITTTTGGAAPVVITCVLMADTLSSTLLAP